MSRPATLSAWARPAALGLCLSLAAVWPVTVWRVKYAALLWQPLLLAVLLWWSIAHRRDGWRVAVARSGCFYVLFTLAAWLPTLRTTTYYTYYPYPRAYGYYLSAYEAVIAACIAMAGCHAAWGRAGSWWTRGGWSRPLSLAPLLLLLRGGQAGQWVSVLAGVAAGAGAALWWRRRQRGARMPSLRHSWLMAGVFLAAAILAYGSGMRIYTQTGDGYPAASDDGPSYYQQAAQMAEHPGDFLTDKLGDQVFFTGYYPLMALWFRLVGNHSMPAWLLWHGVAAGILALCVYWLGRQLGGTVVGLLAAWLSIADRVMLHLMGTMNAETFFIPALYAALVWWVMAGNAPPARQAWLSVWAGAMLGLATIFRPTSALLPLCVIAACVVERQRQGLKSCAVRAGQLLLGFIPPVALLLLRNRVAWGHWELASQKASLAMEFNPALAVHGKPLAVIGARAWLQEIVADPPAIWRIVRGWWDLVLSLWTHPGFGQMDLVRGLNHDGPYQAALATIVLVGAVIGIIWACRRRSRPALMLLAMPAYFTGLVLVFFVRNSRYRSPFIPALYLLCCLGGWLVVRALRAPMAAAARDGRAATTASAETQPTCATAT